MNVRTEPISAPCSVGSSERGLVYLRPSRAGSPRWPREHSRRRVGTFVAGARTDDQTSTEEAGARTGVRDRWRYSRSRTRSLSALAEDAPAQRLSLLRRADDTREPP